jgi:hypothetical protein
MWLLCSILVFADGVRMNEAQFLEALQSSWPAPSALHKKQTTTTKRLGIRKWRSQDAVAKEPPPQVPATKSPNEKMWDLLYHRCSELLDDKGLELERRGGKLSEVSTNMQLSLLFRERQLEILRQVIALCNAKKAGN